MIMIIIAYRPTSFSVLSIVFTVRPTSQFLPPFLSSRVPPCPTPRRQHDVLALVDELGRLSSDHVGVSVHFEVRGGSGAVGWIS